MTEGLEQLKKSSTKMQEKYVLIIDITYVAKNRLQAYYRDLISGYEGIVFDSHEDIYKALGACQEIAEKKYPRCKKIELSILMSESQREFIDLKRIRVSISGNIAFAATVHTIYAYDRSRVE